uniref:HIG1 domain-containing protein n=2 Tax=Pectinophora gossypiella TaxID=13191 RepID=A0A1E1WDW2_PECGO
MAQERPVFDYHEESHGEKLTRKAKESPFMIIGLASLAGAVGLGAYKYKTRGAMSTSVYLMQFRVISQGAVVAALTAGMAYTLYNNHFRTKETGTVLAKPNEH